MFNAAAFWLARSRRVSPCSSTSFHLFSFSSTCFRHSISPTTSSVFKNISVGFQSQHISSDIDEFGYRPGIFVLRLPATSIRIFVLLRSAYRARASIASHTSHLFDPRLIYAGVCLQDIRYQSLSITRLHLYVTGNPRIVLKCSQKIQASPMGRFAMHAALAVVAGLRVTKATRMT